MSNQSPKNAKYVIGFLVLAVPLFVWADPSCNDELLTSFSSAEYQILIERYSPERSKEVAEDPAIRIGLAAMYKWGIGIESDAEAASRFLEGVSKAEAEQVTAYWGGCAKVGNIAARILLGIIYYEGLGVEQDLYAAEYCFSSLEAPIARLGLAATYGRLGKTDKVQQLIDDIIASSPGLDAFKIGELYYHGIIFDKNYRSAAEWYERFANEGGYYALGILGYMYTTGLGVEKNQEKGRYWFDRQSSHPDFKADNRKPIISDIYSNKDN